MTDFRQKIEPGSAKERMVLGTALAFSFAVMLLDQVTKGVVEAKFSLHESINFTPFFSLTYVINKGAAWSIFSGYGWLLLAVAFLVVAASIYFMRYLTEGYLERYFAIFAILGGVAGNSIDRIWRGAVVDFLHFHYQSWSWPVFNIADISICVGVGLFVLSSLLRPASKKAATA